MKRAWLLAALAALTMLLAAALSAAAADTTITVQMTAQNGSGESGTATLTDLGNGQTKVVVNLTGAPAGVAQPAHIHEGTCSNLNPTPKYPLTSVMDGKSETTVPVSLADLMSESYAINVHKSQAEVQTYFSCGDIPAAAVGQVAPKTGQAGNLGLLSLTGLLALAGGALAGGLVLRRRTAR